MAFEGCRNAYESIPNFPTNKLKASQTQDDGAHGSLGQPFFPSPRFRLPENHHTPWPNNAEDPFQLLLCSPNSTRNQSDGTDCDGVTDLYGLVSKILEDDDSSDHLSHTERNLSKFTSIWSPQTTGNDLLHYSQSDATTEADPAFSLHDKYNDQVQEINNLFQHLYGFNTSDQGLSTSSNGDMDSYKPRPLKLTKPPGLPMPSMENCFLSAMRESQQNLISNDASRGPLKNIQIQRNAFGRQGKLDSHLVNDYEDHYTQSRVELYQQNSPQDVNNSVSCFKDLMATKERMVEENNLFLTNFALRTPVRRGPGGDKSPGQREPNGGSMLQAFQDHYRLQGHNTKHIQQSTSDSSPSYPVNSYHSKVITHGQTTPPNVNQLLNQYSQDQTQPSQPPNQASRDRDNAPFNQRQPLSEFGPFPQSQGSPFHTQDFSGGRGRDVHRPPGQSDEPSVRDAGLRGEKRKPHGTAGGSAQDGFLATQSNARLHTHPHARDPRHGLLPQRNHFHFFPQSGDTHGSQRFGVGGELDTGKQPPFLPVLNPGSDPRPGPAFQTGVNPASNASFKPPQPYGGGASGRDSCDRPEGGFAAFKPNVAFQAAQSAGGSAYPDAASTRSPPRVTKNRGGPMSHLHYYLEECCDQLSCLEKERKKSVFLLNKTFAGRRFYNPSCFLLKMPPNPSRVDRLIVGQIREHGRLLSILGKIDAPSSSSLQVYVHSTLQRHYEAIIAAQSRRKEECIHLAVHQTQGSPQDVMPLVVALKDLCGATRKTRRALWCTIQDIVPMSAGVLDVHCNAETPGPPLTVESVPARRS